MTEVVCKDGFGYAIEISDDIIEKVAITEVRYGGSNVEFMKCSPVKITLKDNVTNFVISNYAIIHASDKQAIWN
jgi:hypothetical protein